MLSISHSISIRSTKDFDKVVGILKRQGIEKPIFITNQAEYSINFESDYEHYELVSEMKLTFPEYECFDYIGLGKNEIEIIVSRIQNAHSTDDWGRSLNTNNITTTLYFIKREQTATDHDESSNTIRVLIDQTQEKHINVNIVNGKNKNTGERGFLVVKKSGEGEEPEYLMNRLFKSESEAFWADYRDITRTIEEQYEKYQESQKRKRKNKLSFDDWLMAQERKEKLEKESLLTKEEIQSLKPGDRVMHDVFGIGVIDTINLINCVIDFPVGKKTFVLKFASFRRVEKD